MANVSFSVANNRVVISEGGASEDFALNELQFVKDAPYAFSVFYRDKKTVYKSYNYEQVVTPSSTDIDDLLSQLETLANVQGGGGASWGAITGTLSNQTDLQNVLATKLQTAIPLTFLEFRDAIDLGQLVRGQSYLITNYATRHLIDGTADLNDNVEVEPLLVIASDVDNIFRQVYSRLNPNDIIFWEYTLDICEDATTPRTGKIVYRKDVLNNIETFWDFRKVQVDRSGVKYLSIPDGSKNISIGKTETTGYTYNDLRLGDNCNNVVIGFENYTNTLGSDCQNIKMGAYCYGNVFGSGAYGISFANDCYENIISSNSQRISFGEGCGSNVLTGLCKAFTFGVNCSNNTFEQNSNILFFANHVQGKTFTVSVNNLCILQETINSQTLSILANLENKVYDMRSPDGSLWAHEIDDLGVTTTVKLQ